MRIVTRRRGAAALVALALVVSAIGFAGPAGAVTQTFTWATPANSTYGDGLTSGQLNAVSNVAGSTAYAVVTGPGSTAGMSISVGTVLPAGGYSLKATFTPTDTTNFVTKTATVSLTIDKAKLGVQANNASRAYGAANPSFSLAPFTGFVNGDTSAAVTGSAVLTTTATTSSPVGSYPINGAQGTLAAANYTFVLLSGDLEVGPVTLTVTAGNGSQTYGDTTAPTITPGYSGFVNGDNASSLTKAPTCSANVTSATPVGSYTSSCTGGSSPNYTLQFATGTVTVGAATLTVTASDGSQTYGDTTAPTITPIYSGFKNLDDASSLSSVPTCVANVTATTAVGSYTSSCSGGAGGNYTLHFVNGVVTVGQATLTVTASGGSQTYGDSTAPTITPAYSGFVNGQNSSVLTHLASCSANVSATTPAGTYASTCSGATAWNYTVHYVSGVVTVGKATLTVTASDGTQVYGDIVPATITASYSGFVNGEDASVLSQPAVCTAGVTATTGAGTYASTSSCSGAIADNYTVNYANGTVTVTKAVLTATADDASRAYGAANPPFALSGFSGFRNSDTSAVVSGSAVLGTTANASTSPGTYPITAANGTLSAANYTFVLSPGTLTIFPIVEPVTVVGRVVNNLSVLFYATLTAPDGTLVVLPNVNCTRLVGGAPISKTLAFGTYPIDGTSCTYVPIISGNYVSGAASGSITSAKAGITTVSLPPGVLGKAYPPITRLAETGATGTPVWSVVAGALPNGLTLSSAGTLSGTPTVAAVFPFTVKVVVGAFTETWIYSITVPPLGVTTASLPQGQIGVNYSATLTSNVAKTPAHWSLIGSLPPGLSLTANTGVISGKPTQVGTFNFTIKVTDSASPAHSGTRALSIIINPMMITTTSLKNGKVGTFYSAALAASGGTTPRTWAVISGALPTGLHLSTAGTISGTPSAAGSYTFTVRATDSVGNTATASLTLTVT